MTLRRLTLLGLFLNPTQPPSPTGAAIKGCPLLIQFNSRTGSFAFGTRSGFHSDPYHFVHCVVFCNPFHLCLELINLIGIFKIIFYYYAITVISIFPLCTPPPSTPCFLRQFFYHCACPWVMCLSALTTPFPILYFTSPWLFCDYLFVVLNPLTSSPLPLNPPHLATIKTLSVSMILSLFLFA